MQLKTGDSLYAICIDNANIIKTELIIESFTDYGTILASDSAGNSYEVHTNIQGRMYIHIDEDFYINNLVVTEDISYIEFDECFYLNRENHISQKAKVRGKDFFIQLMLNTVFSPEYFSKEIEKEKNK